MRVSAFHVWLLGSGVIAGLLAAQSGPPTPPSAQTAGIGSASLLPPMPESPGDFLRRLLRMPAAARERELAKEPEDLRNYWRGKLQEYDALAPRIRDTRLRAVQFRWELLSLMKMAPADRGSRLNTLSAGDRAFLQQRLAQWDALPAPVQREFLGNETTIFYFLRLQSGTPQDQARALETFPLDSRKKLEADLARWRALTPDRREKTLERFNRFFELTEEERHQILGILSEPQRRQAEPVLQAIERLPKTQRQQVIEALQKFADLTAAQRDQFLQNAARWEAMSPREREAWLKLMHQLPPLPPGMEPMPPLPDDFGTPPPTPPGLTVKSAN